MVASAVGVLVAVYATAMVGVFVGATRRVAVEVAVDVDWGRRVSVGSATGVVVAGCVRVAVAVAGAGSVAVLDGVAVLEGVPVFDGVAVTVLAVAVVAVAVGNKG